MQRKAGVKLQVIGPFCLESRTSTNNDNHHNQQFTTRRPLPPLLLRRPFPVAAANSQLLPEQTTRDSAQHARLVCWLTRGDSRSLSICEVDRHPPITSITSTTTTTTTAVSPRTYTAIFALLCRDPFLRCVPPAYPPLLWLWMPRVLSLSSFSSLFSRRWILLLWPVRQLLTRLFSFFLSLTRSLHPLRPVPHLP